MRMIAGLTAKHWDHPAAEGAGEPILRLEIPGSTGFAPDWALLQPGSNSDTWAVFLHGHGSGGDQLYTREDIRRQWLPALRQAGVGILSPNLGGNAWMGPSAATQLHQLLNFLRQTHGVRKIVLVGGSMGGTSALIFACLFPQEVAGVLTLCPATDLSSYWHWCQAHADKLPVLEQIHQAITAAYGGTPVTHPAVYHAHSALENADRLTMPIAISHGDADQIIPVEQSRRLIGRLQAHPALRYQEIPGGGHDDPLITFPVALQWLLQSLR